MSAPAPAPFAPGDGSRFLNRELSWLEFNARVLALAEDQTLPLLERAKFLAIFGQNLDEFFQVRVSGLQEQLDAGVRGTSPDGLDPAAAAPRDPHPGRRAGGAPDRASSPRTSRPASKRRASASPTGASSTTPTGPSSARSFDERVFPVLTPLAVDPAHPFPYISNLSLNLARRWSATRPRARSASPRVKVPPLLPRFIPLPDGERFLPLEQLIAARLDALFPGMERPRATTPSASPATPTSTSRTRTRTCSRRSRPCCTAGRSSAGSCGSRSTRRCRPRCARCSAASSRSPMPPSP